MIQHKKYDNETTDDMIKNENESIGKVHMKKLEIVLEKENLIIQLKIR